MGEPLLSIHDLHVYYGKSHVIQGVSLQVSRSERVVILGRNGMGKTTLLRSILGLKSVVRRGSIWFAGEELVAKKTYEIAAREIGYVPQGWQLFPSLSVNEHLRFSFRSKNRNKGYTWTPDAVYELFPELRERKRVSGTRLSGGEQQMLAIGRALVTNPILLLVDEPSEGLAPEVIRRIMKVCEHLVEAGITLLLVEQNLEVAKRLAQRVYIMSNGYVVYEASGERFAADKEAQHQYLGV